MKSTLIKDVGAELMNMAAVQTGRSTAAGEFQKIWNSQMNKSPQDSQSASKQQSAASEKSAVDRTEDSSQLQSQTASRIQKNEPVRGEEPETAEELSEQELEQVMEVLAATAAELMQKLADAFGITVEELQAAMDEMGLKPMELLDASVLGSVVLELGGGQDACALVTDEALYGKYQMLMDQLKGALQEDAKALNLMPEELALLAKEGLGEEVPAEENVSAAKETESVNVLPQEAAGSEGQETVQAQQTAQDASRQESGQAKGESRQSGGRAEEGDHPNILIQDIRTEQFQPDGMQAEAIVRESSWTEQTRDIMNQIMDYMRIHLSPDSTSLEMQLHPASLGTLQVQIASRAGVVTANFIAQNEAVKAALESQIVQLRESFEAQGVRIEAIEVTVQTHEFEQNLEQGRGRSQQEPERRNRLRRVRPDSSVSMDAGDVREASGTGRMTMDGSTVDYIA